MTNFQRLQDFSTVHNKHKTNQPPIGNGPKKKLYEVECAKFEWIVGKLCKTSKELQDDLKQFGLLISAYAMRLPLKERHKEAEVCLCKTFNFELKRASQYSKKRGARSL